ncbi:MAG: hypothetical protein IPJ76_05475 [Flavobacteriales bacterium]|nr:MAG: hypothetical protein IPJ76_05475 [Flavobacteriales bacterium]
MKHVTPSTTSTEKLYLDFHLAPSLETSHRLLHGLNPRILSRLMAQFPVLALDDHRVQDVLVEAQASMIRSAERGTLQANPSNVEGYLYIILRNAVLGMLRRVGNMQFVSIDDPGILESVSKLEPFNQPEETPADVIYKVIGLVRKSYSRILQFQLDNANASDDEAALFLGYTSVQSYQTVKCRAYNAARAILLSPRFRYRLS